MAPSVVPASLLLAVPAIGSDRPISSKVREHCEVATGHAEHDASHATST
jgi:hypothetical protein